MDGRTPEASSKPETFAEQYQSAEHPPGQDVLFHGAFRIIAKHSANRFILGRWKSVGRFRAPSSTVRRLTSEPRLGFKPPLLLCGFLR